MLPETPKGNFWDVENLETALVMKEICNVQGISRTYGETVTVNGKNAFLFSLLFLL